MTIFKVCVVWELRRIDLTGHEKHSIVQADRCLSFNLVSLNKWILKTKRNPVFTNCRLKITFWLKLNHKIFGLISSLKWHQFIIKVTVQHYKSKLMLIKMAKTWKKWYKNFVFLFGIDFASITKRKKCKKGKGLALQMLYRTENPIILSMYLFWVPLT